MINKQKTCFEPVANTALKVKKTFKVICVEQFESSKNLRKLMDTREQELKMRKVPELWLNNDNTSSHTTLHI